MPREIFVPDSELGTIFEAAADRVMLPRSEFEDMLRRARAIRLETRSDAPKAPCEALLLSSDYDIDIVDQRAVITGTLEIELLTDGPVALPLTFNRVSLLDAHLAGTSSHSPAAIGSSPNDPNKLLILEGKGRRTVRLRMTTPLEIDSTRQRLAFQVPRGSGVSMRLSVPGDVELKSGAAVVSRNVAKGRTRFELLPDSRTETELLMTLNSHRAGSHTTILARSVQFAEVTDQYEQLHATVSINERHQGIQKMSFHIPAGFEMTDVGSLLLDRWSVQKGEEGKRDVLEIRFREQRPGLTTIRLSAINTATTVTTNAGAAWRFPLFEPIDASSNSAVLGLLLDTDLEMLGVETKNLFPVDTMTLKDAIPASALNALPGSPSLRLALAWYMPQADGRMTATFRRPEAQFLVDARQTLLFSDDTPELAFNGRLTVRTGRIFETTVSAPKNWKITAVTDETGRPLDFRTRESEWGGEPSKDSGSPHPNLLPKEKGMPDNHLGDSSANEDGKIVISLPQGIGVGESFTLQFQAVGAIDDWFLNGDEKTLRYPLFRFDGAVSETGRIFVRSTGDVDREIQPAHTEHLTILDEKERSETDAALALHYDAMPFELDLRLKKTEPRCRAKIVSFYRFEPKLLRVRYEIEYTVEQARTRLLEFQLPGDTPATLDIRGLDGLDIKETFSENLEHEDGDKTIPARLWKVQLARPQSGRLRLAVDFEMPIDDAMYEKPDFGMELPRLFTQNTAWQSTLIAVEGDEELDVTMPPETLPGSGKPVLRPVDVGVLGSATYRPGNRLLGVFTAFDEPIVVGIQKNTVEKLPSVLVRRVSVTARLEPGPHDSTLYLVRYEIQLGGGSVRAALADGDELWSVSLDGTTVKPQRIGDDILVPIPPRPGTEARKLTLLYRSKNMMKKIERKLAYPQLKLTGPSEAEPIAVMQTEWNVLPPSGFEVVRLGNVVVRREMPEPALFDVFRGGLGFFAALTWRPEIGCGARAAKHAATLGLSSTEVPASPYYMNNRLDHSESNVDMELLGSDASQDAFISAMLTVDEAATPESLEESKKEAKLSDDAHFLILSERRKERHAVAQNRRLQSAQPVTVVVSQDDASETVGERLDIGSVREMTVRLEHLDGKRRIGLIAGLVTFLVALSLLRRNRVEKSRFVFGLMLLGTVAPLLVSWTPLWNGVVYGAALAGVLFVLVALCRTVFVRKTVATTLLVTLCCLATPLHAEEEKMPKIALPGDAVIVPYAMGDVVPNKLPDVDGLVRPDQMLFVPLERHRTLLELLHRYENRQKKNAEAPLSYTASSVRYEATVHSETELELAGKLRINLFTDRPVLVPLTLEGGVMVDPKLDDRPATIQAPSPSQSILLVEGAGSHELSFTVRLRVQRQGGWRIVTGKLPVATSSNVLLHFPEEIDDLLAGNPLDKRKWSLSGTEMNGVETKTVETAPAADGSFRWQWRSAVSEAGVDRNLEVESVVRLDIQEDGCWVRWTPTLKIGRGRWEMLRLKLPNDYTIVDISGENVRGWSVAPAESDTVKESLIDIELLKPAEKREMLHVQLVKTVAVESVAETVWTLPRLSLPEAGIHRGRIDLYRGASQSLRVTDLSGLSPTDMPRTTAASTLYDAASPLGLQPFQSYRYVFESHGMTVHSRPVPERKSVDVETVLKITRSECLVEAKLRLGGSDKPFCAAVRLPGYFVLKDVEAPSGVFFNRQKTGAEEILNLSCGDGFEGGVEVLLRGRLRRDVNDHLWTPRFEVVFPEVAAENIVHKMSTAVLTEPSLDVRADELRNCRIVAPDRVFSWLPSPEQRELVRLALDVEKNTEKDFAARLVLSERKPEIRCSTITNIRTTAEAMEETTLLDFVIARAGVRTLEFTLPERPEDVKIEAPLLRRKTVTPSDAEDGRSSMHVKLELQEEIIGQYRVLVQTDRPLRPETDYAVIVPKMDAGQVARQYIVMENDRRSSDEMAVDPNSLVRLRPLNRQQNEWHYLASMLGGNVTEAYCVTGEPDGTTPSLSFRMRRRETVRMTAAQIGLSETRLVLGENGSYRAEQIYRIDNKTEPYLDILLPEGAAIWGARTLTAEEWNRKKQGERDELGRSVKPCAMPAKVFALYAVVGKTSSQALRIPLVKTESGDLDYVIRLVYAGTMPKMRSLKKLEMPFLTVLNVPVGQSLVRLHLPDGYDYLFDGGLQRIESHREQDTVRQAETDYEYRQSDRLQQTLKSENPYAAGRARKNLTQNPVFSKISKIDTFRYIGENGKEDNDMVKGGKGVVTFGKSQAAQIDYPDIDVVVVDATENEVSFSSNTVTIRKQFLTQSNKLSNDAVGQKALTLNGNGSVNGGAINSANSSFRGNPSGVNDGAVNAGFDQGWLSNSNLSNDVSSGQELNGVHVNHFSPPVSGVRESDRTMQPSSVAAVPQTNRPAPQPGMMPQQAIPQQQGQVEYRPMMAPLESQTNALQRQLPQSQMQSRNVEVQGGNIVLNSRSQRSGGEVPQNADFQSGNYSGGVVGGRGGMGGGISSGSVIRSEGRRSSGHTTGVHGFTHMIDAPAVVSGTEAMPAPASAPLSPAKPSRGLQEGEEYLSGQRGSHIYEGKTEASKPAEEKPEPLKIAVGLPISAEPQAAPQPVPPVVGLSTRSASLDIELPVSGRSYLFTTPQGALELSLRPVTSRWFTESLRWGAALLGLALLYGAYRLCLVIGSRWTFDRRTHRNVAGLVTLLGVLSLPLAPMVFLLSMLVAAGLWTTLLKRDKEPC